MNIGGLQKFSSLDYPGKLSAVIFCQGCPLRCVYCHNQELQSCSRQSKFAFFDVLSFLKTRQGLLDAVVFSGGEPLLQSDLKESMAEVKNLGFLIGLHTSGIIPERFKEILSIVDWIGFDIKTVFDDYEKITQVPNSGRLAQQSFELLVQNHSNFEIRTTFDPTIISEGDLLNIAILLKTYGISEWIIQECVLRNVSPAQKLPLPSKKCLDELSKYVRVIVRRQ